MSEEKAPGRTDLPMTFLNRLYNGVIPVTSKELPSFRIVPISTAVGQIFYIYL